MKKIVAILFLSFVAFAGGLSSQAFAKSVESGNVCMIYENSQNLYLATLRLKNSDGEKSSKNFLITKRCSALTHVSFNKENYDLFIRMAFDKKTNTPYFNLILLQASGVFSAYDLSRIEAPKVFLKNGGAHFLLFSNTDKLPVTMSGTLTAIPVPMGGTNVQINWNAIKKDLNSTK